MMGRGETVMLATPSGGHRSIWSGGRLPTVRSTSGEE